MKRDYSTRDICCLGNSTLNQGDAILSGTRDNMRECARKRSFDQGGSYVGLIKRFLATSTFLGRELLCPE